MRYTFTDGECSAINLVERSINKVKHWRRVAVRYDKLPLIISASLSAAPFACGRAPHTGNFRWD